MDTHHLFFALHDHNDRWSIVEIRPGELLNPAAFETEGIKFRRTQDRLIFTDKDEQLEVTEELVTGDLLWVGLCTLIFAKSATEALDQIDQVKAVGEQPRLLELECATLDRHGRGFIASRSRR